MQLPKSVRIMEVGPRDGLQNEKTIVDTASKIACIEALVAAGVKRIEITAFVSPKWILPLADQMEVANGVHRQPGVSYAALIPNMKGYEAAVQAKIDEVAFIVSASNTHNQKNINSTTAQAMARYAEIAKQAQKDKIPFRAYVSCSFGCPYEGDVPVSKVVSLSQELLQMGAYEIAVSDTIGVGQPVQTIHILEELLKVSKVSQLALHLHDTRGIALANIFAALQLGVSSFDSSIGGLGGCPYAPGASGNVASEDLVNMLNVMGIETGINVDKLCDVSLKMEQLVKRTLPARMISVYRPCTV